MANRVEVIFAAKDQGLSDYIRRAGGELDGLGSKSANAGRQVDASLSVFKGTLIADFFRRGGEAALSFARDAVDAFTRAQGAALGLQSAAQFKGISPQAAQEALQSLDIVRNGLISVGQASQALQNLLLRGFSLEQSTQLIKAFGDAAAFNRQASLTLGEAVQGAAEGVKNLNSAMSDNAGISKNLSVILKERGFELQDVDDKVKGAAAREALYAGLVAETAAQTGNAAKFANTFAGQQARLDAEYQKLLVSTGETIVKNAELSDGIDIIIGRMKSLSAEGGNTALKSFFEGIVTNIGLAIQQADLLLERINALNKPADRAGIATSGRGIQENLREQGTPTTGLELLDFVDRIRRIAADNLRQGVEGIGSLFGFRGSGKSPIDEMLDRISRAAEKLTRPPDLTAADRSRADAEDLASRIRATGADPFKQAQDIEFMLKRQVEVYKQIDAEIQKAAESEKKRAEVSRQADRAIEDLQAKLSVNPYVVLFDGAARSQEEFMQKFRDATDEQKQKINELQQQSARTDLFRGALGQGLGLAHHFFERAKLEAGFAGKRNLTAADERRLEGLASRAVDQQISIAQNLLAKAENAQQRQIANAAIISATPNLSTLTPAQAEARLKALNDQIAIEVAAFQESANRLKDQTDATKKNTLELVAVGNKLAQVEGALGNFAKQPLTLVIEDETGTVVGVQTNLGSVSGV